MAMRQHLVWACNHSGLLGNWRARIVGRPFGTGSGRGGSAQGADTKYMYNELLPQQHRAGRVCLPNTATTCRLAACQAAKQREEGSEAGVRWRVYAAVVVTNRVLLSRH